jgi:LemA protein
MKKSYIIWGVVILVIIILISSFVRPYNRMVNMLQEVQKQWADVQTVYQARMDKTKNLLKIVEGSAKFEKSTLIAVVEARSKVSQVNVNADNLSPENIKKFQQAQDAFSGSLSRLMVVVEKYPELKTTDAFRDFQAQYEGMENRITVERRKYNEVVADYNKMIKRFPNNFFASMYGFTEKGYFESSKGAENAPDVNFNIQ